MKLYQKLEQVREFVNECETQDKQFYLNALDTAIKKLKVKTESRIPLGTYGRDLAEIVKSKVLEHYKKTNRKVKVIMRPRGHRMLYKRTKNGLQLICNNQQKDIPVKYAQMFSLYLVDEGVREEPVNRKPWEVVFTDDYIEVHDHTGQFVTWTKEEWKQDDEVPFYISNAITRVAKGLTIIPNKDEYTKQQGGQNENVRIR